MNQPYVSIITTYYNSVKLGNFVATSMNCLLNQTYRNIEFICVDDGSTDNTLLQLYEYASQDSRIKVFTKENELYAQYSKAYGQDKATGDFIFLFDHDDTIALDCIEKCLEVFTENHDVDIVTPIIKAKSTDHVIKYICNLDQYINCEKDYTFRKISGAEAIKKTVGRYDIHIRGLYRSQTFKNYSYRFNEPLLNADEIVERLNFESAKNIASAPTLYTHYIHLDSSAKKPSIKIIDIVKTDLLLRAIFKEKNIYQDRSAIFEFTAYRNLISAAKTFHHFKKNMSTTQKKHHLERLKNSFQSLDKQMVLNEYTSLAKIYHKVLLSSFIIFNTYYSYK